MSKELYIQVEKCLADSEAEAAVYYINELKKLGGSENKDLLRLERICLDQLYYLLNESLNRCDVASSQRLTHSYLSLKNDGRIALMQQKLKLLEKQEQLKSSSGNVNCDSVSEKNGRRFFKRSKILKIAGFILILSIIVGIIVYTDEQGMWADKAMTAAKATADSIRIADSIAAVEVAAAEVESEEHISRVVSTYTYKGDNVAQAEKVNDVMTTSNVSIPKEKLSSLIYRWNDAHTNNDLATLVLLYVYTGTVKFYGMELMRDECVNNFSAIYNKQRNFSQRIVSDITFENVGVETYKCCFVKRVITNGKIKNYPSYLVFKQVDNIWCIIEESDEVTDQNLKRMRNSRAQ